MEITQSGTLHDRIDDTERNYSWYKKRAPYEDIMANTVNGDCPIVRTRRH